MDDDYDNYVPQISRMDFHLGQDNENSQIRAEGSAPAIGPSGSGSFLYECNVVGASQPVNEASQHYQRSFPGMRIMPVQSFVGVVDPAQVYLSIIVQGASNWRTGITLEIGFCWILFMRTVKLICTIGLPAERFHIRWSNTNAGSITSTG